MQVLWYTLRVGRRALVTKIFVVMTKTFIMMTETFVTLILRDT